jgi:hypothetical protein
MPHANLDSLRLSTIAEWDWLQQNTSVRPATQYVAALRPSLRKLSLSCIDGQKENILVCDLPPHPELKMELESHYCAGSSGPVHNVILMNVYLDLETRGVGILGEGE